MPLGHPAPLVEMGAHGLGQSVPADHRKPVNPIVLALPVVDGDRHLGHRLLARGRVPKVHIRTQPSDDVHLVHARFSFRWVADFL